MIFGREYDIQLSLSVRSKMEHPILLGRKFIQDKFVVDVSRFDLSKENRIIPVNESVKPRRQKPSEKIKTAES